MRLFVDCEFDGFRGALISIALVSEDGREFYEVVEITDRVLPWVAENVLPVLGKSGVSIVILRYALHEWLRQFDRPCITADWPSDLVHFFDCLLGVDHGSTLEYPCTAEFIPSLTYTSAIPHNALADARGLRDAFAMRAAA